MKTVKTERTFREKKITASVALLDQGIQAGLYGGDLTHIGAVSIVSAEGKIQTIVFPGHKEAVLSERWAQRLARMTDGPAAVCAGIHYDGLTGEEIRRVVELAEEMLEEVEELLQMTEGEE